MAGNSVAAAAAPFKASIAVGVPRGLQASVVAPAEPVLVAVRGRAEAVEVVPEVAGVVAEVVEAVAGAADSFALVRISRRPIGYGGTSDAAKSRRS